MVKQGIITRRNFEMGLKLGVEQYVTLCYETNELTTIHKEKPLNSIRDNLHFAT